jgi:hypothetical protein
MPQVGTLAQDKAFLLTIVENNYTLPDEIDPYEFALALMANFASPDGVLRDELSYRIFTGALIEKRYLTSKQLQNLLTLALDENHLFYHIGEVKTDSVFMRSFSCLVIAAILYIDVRDPQFPSELIKQTKEALFRYARSEKDWRGYVEGKGWAHAMAHLSDALDEYTQHPGLKSEDRENVLQLVSELLTVPTPLYHEEDTRLALIPYHVILGKQVDEEFIAAWIRQCMPSRDRKVIPGARETNGKNFLRSLYFFLLWDNIGLQEAEQISDLLLDRDSIFLGRG